MRNARYLFAAAIFLLGIPPAFAAPAKNMVVCVAKKTGSIGVKSKCTKSETRLAESSYSEGRTTILKVATKGAKFASIGAAVAAASALSPSATNPILIKLAPGRYDVQSQISVPSFVTLEGAGAGTSIVAISSDGFIGMSTSSILRRMTISLSSAISNGAAVDLSGGPSDVTVEDVAFVSSINDLLTGTSYFIFTAGSNNILQRLSFKSTSPMLSVVAIFVVGGSAVIDGVRMNLEGRSTGVLVAAGSATVRNSTFTARKTSPASAVCGIRAVNSSSSLMVENTSVTIEGDDFAGASALWASNSAQITARNSAFALTGFHYGAVQADESGTVDVLDSDVFADSSSPTAGAYSGGTLSIGSSRLRGGAVTTQPGSTTRCAGVYDESFAFSASSCP